MDSSFGKMHGDDTTNARFDGIALAIAVVILIGCGLSALIAALLPPDPAVVPAAVALDFLPFDSAVRPEPTERMIFVAVSLLLPLLCAVVVQRVLAHDGDFGPRVSRALALAVSVLVVASILNAPGTRRVFRVDQPWTLLAVSLATVVTGAVSLRQWARGDRGTTAPGSSRLPSVIGAVVGAVLTVLWRPLPMEALRPSFRHYANLDAVLAPVVAATHGGLPLVDYTSQYGVYAVWLAPLFASVGLSVTTFTLTMTALHLVALGAVMSAMLADVRSRILAFAGCVAVAFVAGGYVPPRFDPDPYFQYWPVRFFWPALMVPLVWAWSRTSRNRWLILASLASGVALTWNVDSGIAAAGAWLGLLLVRAAAAMWMGTRGRHAIVEFAQALCVALVPVLAFAAWLRWRAGGPVDFAAVFDAHRRFYLTGFFMRPLPLHLHAWHLVAATYVGAMVVGVASTLGHIRNPRAVVVLFLSFLGVGLFAYYQGRSTDQTLVAASWPAVVILVLCADWVRTLAREGRLQRWAAGMFAAATLALGIYCAAILAWSAPRIVQMTSAQWHPRSSTPVAGNVAFIRSHSDSAVPVIARFQAIYAAEAQRSLALDGHPVAESVSQSLGRAHVRQLERMRPERLFLGVPYLEDTGRNPYRALLPLIARDYELRARTSGTEELRLYVRRR